MPAPSFHAAPSWFMPVEVRAYKRGWRHGYEAKPQARSKHPLAYRAGYFAGITEREKPQ